MFRHREIVGSCRLLCEDAHLVDEVGDELAPPDFQYPYGLARGLQGRLFAYCVAGGPVAVDQVPSSS